MRVEFCCSCGFVFLNPRFTPEEIERKYRACKTIENKGISLFEQETVPLRGQRIYDLITDWLGGRPSGKRVLDYGGARGGILLPFTAENESSVLDYVKLETIDGVRYAGRDLQALGPEDKFDIILLCHTLEHASEPVGMLQSLLEVLAEQGIIYVEVPLGAFREWRVLKEPLTHLNFFSEQSLCSCLSQAGFRVTSVETRFQFSVSSKSWCVNSIADGIPATTPATHTRARSTRRQMNNPLYYARPVLNRISRSPGRGFPPT